MKAQRGSICIDLPNLNLLAKWGWVVNATLLPLDPQERAPVPIVQKARWAQGPVWTGVEERKSLAPPPLLGFEPETAQPVASRYNDYAIPAPKHVI